MRQIILLIAANADTLAEFVDAAKGHDGGSWRIFADSLKSEAFQRMRTAHF
jgi:hypothetical protein